MTKTGLIIGAALGYDWEKVKHWVNSVKMTGFNGVSLLVIRKEQSDLASKLDEVGLKYAYIEDVLTEDLFEVDQASTPYVGRFLVLWKLLRSFDDAELCVITDVRDVIFQSDPFEWLRKNLGDKSVVVSSEQVLYAEEPWGRQNIEETFDKAFAHYLMNNEIFNVGVVAGVVSGVRDLCGLIYQLSLNRKIPITDQSTFNYIASLDIFSQSLLKTSAADAWAVQMGTTKMIVTDGVGSFAHYYRFHKEALEKLSCEDPLIIDGELCNKDGSKYVIVHQYDRLPVINQMVAAKYGG